MAIYSLTSILVQTPFHYDSIPLHSRLKGQLQQGNYRSADDHSKNGMVRMEYKKIEAMPGKV